MVCRSAVGYVQSFDTATGSIESCKADDDSIQWVPVNPCCACDELTSRVNCASPAVFKPLIRRPQPLSLKYEVKVSDCTRIETPLRINL